MEQKNISLNKGIHRTPSLGDAGELSECVNLIPKNGELVNIPDVKSLGVNVPSNHTILYVHKKHGNSGYTNYINEYNNSLYNGSTLLVSKKPNSVTSVGDTLCVATSEGMRYFLYKDGSYKDLGTHVPEIGLSFNLVGRFILKYGDSRSYGTALCSEYDVQTGNSIGLDLMNLSESIQNQVFALLNENEVYSKEKGFFNYPFYIRYAIELYDGSHIMHSSPILMTPNDSGLPTVRLALDIDANEPSTRVKPYLFMSEARLTCKLIKSISSDWSDIVKGIDVFVTPQIQRYKENPRPQNYIPEQSDYITSFRGLFFVGGVHETDWNSNWPEVNEQTIAQWHNAVPPENTIEPEWGFTGFTKWNFLSYDKEEWLDMIAGASTFYKVKSIPLDSLSAYTSRRYLDIPGGKLTALETQEALIEDTGYSHDTYVPDNVFSYNSRLLLVGSSRIINGGMIAESTLPYVGEEGSSFNTDNDYLEYIRVGFSYDTTTSPFPYAQLDTNNRLWGNNGNGNLIYFFYPDPRATCAVFSGMNLRKVIKLKPHPSLYGAYAFNGFSELQNDNSISLGTEGVVVNVGNRLISSEVDNPFVFKGSKQLTLPNQIFRVSTANKAMSQGQFGQFPIYAFCDDGIWAVEISSTGELSSKQPLSRDVLIPGSDVCQLDDSVAYITNEGVKILRGSETKLISEPLHGLNFNDGIIGNVLTSSHDYYQLVVNDSTNFIDQLDSSTRLVFDSSNRQLHVFTNGLKSSCLHFVNQLGTTEWTTQLLDNELTTSVPGYPTPYLQFGNSLYTYDHNVKTTLRQGYFLTRPDYMGDMLARKCIHDLRVVGQKTNANSSIKVIVLVSNDLQNWARLRSLKGMSAKYYRYLVLTNLTDIDTISGIAINYEERYSHKFR